MSDSFRVRLQRLTEEHNNLLGRKNSVLGLGNGLIDRYKFPVLTALHTPLFWRYDFDESTNPFCMERLGINAVLNSGAIYHDGKYILIARVEGYDRKSFFGVAESDSPIEGFKFRDYPLVIPQNENPDTNVYDMRVIKHEDGWFYGTFCSERKDPDASICDTSSAVAACGIIRSRDLETWERLPDLVTPSPQQRNVTIHPEFVDGKYAFYTRPQDGFINAGSGGGICIGYLDNMENPIIEKEILIDGRVYHTIKESKNGQGPSPIKTDEGWLHIAHGVRNTAAGLRYVLYAFMTSLDNPEKIICSPGGYLLAPEGEERIGDVSNVLFCNGMIADEQGNLYIYYASSDTRVHVGSTTIEKMIDYCKNTPPDVYESHKCVEQRSKLIRHNLSSVSAN